MFPQSVVRKSSWFPVFPQHYVMLYVGQITARNNNYDNEGLKKKKKKGLGAAQVHTFLNNISFYLFCIFTNLYFFYSCCLTCFEYSKKKKVIVWLICRQKYRLWQHENVLWNFITEYTFF